MHKFYFLLSILIPYFADAQSVPVINFQPNHFFDNIGANAANHQNNIEDITRLINDWDKYPGVVKADQNYIFYYKDSIFGNVPLRLYIPKRYNASKKTPFILLLHGATQVSSFDRANALPNAKKTEADDDIFFEYLRTQGYIILRPYADNKRKFSWVNNLFRNINEGQHAANYTYQYLVKVITFLKQQLNIDDAKIFAFGHSDGSDGAFAMELFQPTMFAGFIIYNSMLTNFNDDIFLNNLQNRQAYMVHSDKDAIRPIEQNRKTIASLKKYSSIYYKEYIGYQHYDKHLQIDMPFAVKFMQRTVRNPFPSNIYWESSSKENNQCDWIKVLDYKMDLPKAAWHTDINFNSYNKINKTWQDYPYYYNGEGYAVTAKYDNNIFTIETSRVTKIEILLSGKMINTKQPIKVYINKHLVYNKIVNADPVFEINYFRKTRDRQAAWISSITLTVQ